MPNFGTSLLTQRAKLGRVNDGKDSMKIYFEPKTMIKNLLNRLAILISSQQDGFDVKDFRVGTIIGTLVLTIVPILNSLFHTLLPDDAIARNIIIVIQIAFIVASYSVRWVKKYANLIGNIFSVTYAFFVITITANAHFPILQTATCLLAIASLVGMFKDKKMMSYYLLTTFTYFLLLLNLIGSISPELHSLAYTNSIAFIFIGLTYYIFWAKIDAIDALTQSRKMWQDSELRFKNIVNNAPIGIAILSRKFRGVQYNEHFERLTGYSEDELLKIGVQNIIHHEDAIPLEALENIAINMFGKGQNFHKEQRLMKKNGQIAWMRITLSPLMISNEPYIIAMFEDFTAEKETDLQLRESARQLRSHNDALEEFSYVISHDLQEPLRMITTFSQIIQRRYIPQLNDENANKDFNYVIDGAKRMSTLIRDMLEYSRWSAKMLPLETVCSQDILEEVLKNLTIAIAQSEAQVIYHNLPDLTTNRLLLSQVFQNLVSNSIKYRHPQRKPRIEIVSQTLKEETLFEVRDNGAGFEERYRDRIFGIFQRLETDRSGGNGMGLAICKRLIERHGGRIWAHSELGIGSVFSFTIPNSPYDNHLLSETLERNEIATA